jgi:hypothetical protein
MIVAQTVLVNCQYPLFILCETTSFFEQVNTSISRLFHTYFTAQERERTRKRPTTYDKIQGKKRIEKKGIQAERKRSQHI